MATLRGGVIPPTPNPYMYDSGPDQNDLRVVVAFSWDPATKSITAITAHRDVGCEFTTLMVGLGPDGSPNTSPFTYAMPDGDSTAPQELIDQWAADGLATIDDLLTNQIAAG